jgi:hypothetical protein
MCISGTRRPIQTAAGRPFDASVLSKVDVKNESQAPQSYQMSTMEPKPMRDTEALTSSEVSTSPLAKKGNVHNVHIIVQHNYHDHTHDNRADYQEEHPARGGVTMPFPLKLHEMLENVAAYGCDNVVSWQPHGRCFVVHKPKEFGELLPSYFKLSKLPSFQRQLNLYGFQRLTKGRDRGGYYHELFLKGKVFLAHSIQRIKVKGTGVRARSNPDQEPDFWAMPWVSEEEPATRDLKQEQKVVAPVISYSMPQVPSMYKQEEDIVCAFGNKTFHYLDPFQPAPPTKWTAVDELLSTEAQSFFEDFDFPENIGAEIEDDNVFGSMLEQMIA